MVHIAADYSFHRKRLAKAIACIVTAVAFLLNTVACDVSYASDAPIAIPTNSLNVSGNAAPVKELHVDTFTLPEYLGQVKDSFKGGSGRTVIHVQDAHCNYAAQKRIAEIVEYLNTEYGIDTVNLEGGAKEYDLSVFTRIQDKTVRDKVADYFVKEGLVNGAEYFAINNPDKVSLWGIEDTRLYIDNLKVYRESLKFKDEVDRYLASLTHILNNLKIKIYSPKLLELDTRYTQYKAGTIELKDYLAYLLQAAGDKGIDTKAFKDIDLLCRTLKQEGSIDFKAANIQRDELIDQIQKKISKKAINELAEKTVLFRTEKISQKDFYAYLKDKAAYCGISLIEVPDLKKYIEYVTLFDSIDKTKTIEELDALEVKIKEALYRNAEERELCTLSKNLALMENIFKISLARDDYKYYRDNEASFGVADYVSFIEKYAPMYQISAQLDPNISRLDGYRESMVGFYECSFKRDDAFIKNFVSASPAFGGTKRSQAYNNGSAAILITGGFHTENLCEKFKKQGISYISIMPNFKNEEKYECPYFNLLGGRVSNVGQMISSALITPVSTMAIASLWTALGQEVWEGRNIDADKAWVALEAIVVRDGWGEHKISSVKRIDDETLEISFEDGTAPKRVSVNDLLQQAGEEIDAKMAAGEFTPIEADDADRVKAIQMALSLGEQVKDGIEHLANGEEREDENGVRHKLMIQESAGLTGVQDEHAGGWGVSIRPGLTGEKRTEAILHGIIAGFVESHKDVDAITKALMRGDPEGIDMARRIFATAKKHDVDGKVTALWDMTPEQRQVRVGRRDFATTEQITPDDFSQPRDGNKEHQFRVIEYFMGRYAEFSLKKNRYEKYVEPATPTSSWKAAIRHVVSMIPEVGDRDIRAEIIRLAQLVSDTDDKSLKGYLEDVFRELVAAVNRNENLKQRVMSLRSIHQGARSEEFSVAIYVRNVNDWVSGTTERVRIIVETIKRRYPKAAVYVVPQYPNIDSKELNPSITFRGLADLAVCGTVHLVAKDTVPGVLTENLNSATAEKLDGALIQIEISPDMKNKSTLESSKRASKNIIRLVIPSRVLRYEVPNRGLWDSPVVSDLASPWGSVLLDPEWSQLRHEKDLWTEGEYGSYRQRWLAENTVARQREGLTTVLSQSGCVKDATRITWSWCYLVKTEKMKREIAFIKDALGKNNLPFDSSGKNKHILLHMIPHRLAIDQSSDEEIAKYFTEQGITVIGRNGDVLYPTPSDGAYPITVMLHPFIKPPALTQLALASGVFARTKNNQNWIDFPAMATGNGTANLAMGLGLLRHDGLDSGKDKDGQLYILCNRFRLTQPDLKADEDYPGKERIRMSLGDEGVAVRPPYDDLETATLHAVAFRSFLFRHMNGIEDLYAFIDAQLDGEGGREMVHKNVGPFGTSDILIDSGARLALVHEMSSKAKSVGQIRELLQSFEQLPPIERADQEMALRTAVMVDGLRSFDKTRHVNIVAQITKIGQSNSARGPIQKVKSRLGQPDYDLASQSIIEEFETPEQLKPFIDRVVSSVKSAESHDGRGLILLPEHLRGSLGMAKDYLKTQYGIDPDDQNATVRIQEIEQGDNPDLMTQFGLGFEIIEHMRKGPNAQPSDELLNLVAAMVDGAPDPRAVLDNLFKGILRIRKINWQSLDDQRKSWEAVAQAA